jgi:hypothetical protein
MTPRKPSSLCRIARAPLKSAALLETYTERLRELAAATGTSVADLVSGIEESTEDLASQIETLGRIVLRTDDPDQPVN